MAKLPASGYRKKVSIGSDDMTPKIKIRHLVARKMEEAWKTIPHFYVTIAVNMTDVVGMRHEHGASINDFVVAASARSLVQHPWVNATWNGEQAIELEPVNIAMAAATDRGLYYPVCIIVISLVSIRSVFKPELWLKKRQSMDS